jgi:Icc protein
VRIDKVGVSLAILSGFLFSCELFEYHPYDSDVNYSNLNGKAIERIISETGVSDTVTVIAIGDTQRFYDETQAFVKSANQHKADFVLVNGDITDFGLKDEFYWVHDILKKLTMPYVAVIGNHDTLSNGKEVFLKMYGPLNDSFIINGFKFILLNSNSREYNFDGKVPDIQFLNQQLSTDNFDRAIVASHIPPMDGDFDPKLTGPYGSALANSGKVTLSLHAHQHSYSEGHLKENPTPFVVTTSMDQKMYVIFRFFGDQFTLEKIYY